MMENFIFGVSQLNGYIKEMFDADPALESLYVRGEISNYKAYPSGHHYFSLKDEEGTLKCVLFRREASGLRFRPQNGMMVVVLGRVTVFPRDGAYQLYCARMIPDGVGDLHMAFEQRKAKLQAEGLFAEERKRPIPKYPAKIALITSPAGAAVRDMIRILGRRWPLAEVILLPVRVQGEEAAGEIAAAIRTANTHQIADVILTGRGGGSMEDLWAFNEEVVARAIANSQIPVISAVGHEPDVTIADFSADLRAATPSHAAELAVPDQAEELARLRRMVPRLKSGLVGRLNAARRELERMRISRAISDPVGLLDERRMELDHGRRRLLAALELRVSREESRFSALAAKLDALSPLKVLGRGFSIARLPGGEVVTKLAQAVPGKEFSLRVSDGTVPCVFGEEVPR